MGGDPNLGGVNIGRLLSMQMSSAKLAELARIERTSSSHCCTNISQVQQYREQGEIDAAAVEVRGYEAAVLAAGGPLTAAAAAIPLPPSYARCGATGEWCSRPDDHCGTDGT